MGFFAEAGPLQVFVSNHLIPESFEFNTGQCLLLSLLWLLRGCFVGAPGSGQGNPLQRAHVCASASASIRAAHDPCYQTGDGDQRIVAGSEVRLRIVGTRVDASDIVSQKLRRCSLLRWRLCGLAGG